MGASLDMIGMAVKDIRDSLRFYETLGLSVPEMKEGEDHVEAQWSGMRVAWDTVEMIKGFLGEWTEPAGHRVELAFKCEDAADVDATYRRAVDAGYAGYREPWDAFWGQRYAILEDPDGNHVSLFA